MRTLSHDQNGQDRRRTTAGSPDPVPKHEAGDGMAKIGLIGGLSFPSTVTYYDRINRLANRRMGKSHSPRIVLESLDFQPMLEWLAALDGTPVTTTLVDAAKRLENAGAELIAMCCNTVHKYANAVESRMSVPLVNICRCTADEARNRGAKTVGLLGSAFSMEESFYRDEFDRQSIRVVIPQPADRRFMQDSIENELCLGDISIATRDRFLRIANGLLQERADILVLACTEIPLVIRPEDIDAPLLNTVDVHSAAIVERAFELVENRLRTDACG